MRAVVQRVHSASCSVTGETVGEIEQGLLIFLGVGENDGEEAVEYLADKISGLRVFEDQSGKMNHDIQAVEGGLLVIPQFTLYGDVRRGLRPSFEGAAPPGKARKLYKQFLAYLEDKHPAVEAGKFGAMMDIQADNDGPVTILLDSDGAF